MVMEHLWWVTCRGLDIATVKILALQILFIGEANRNGLEHWCVGYCEQTVAIGWLQWKIVVRKAEPIW